MCLCCVDDIECISKGICGHKLSSLAVMHYHKSWAIFIHAQEQLQMYNNNCNSESNRGYFDFTTNIWVVQRMKNNILSTIAGLIALNICLDSLLTFLGI